MVRSVRRVCGLGLGLRFGSRLKTCLLLVYVFLASSSRWFVVFASLTPFSKSSVGVRHSSGGDKNPCPLLTFGPACLKPVPQVETPDGKWCVTPIQSIQPKLFAAVARFGEEMQEGTDINGGAFGKHLAAMGENQNILKSKKDLAHFLLHRRNLPAIAVYEAQQGLGGTLRRAISNNALPAVDLPQLIGPGRTCAVVGSSSSLKNGNAGSVIDFHDVIFRFNRAPTHGFERDVGSRTSIRIQNPERFGWGEGRGDGDDGQELCLAKGMLSLTRSGTRCKVAALSPQFVTYSRLFWAMEPVPKNLEASVPAHNGLRRLKFSTGFLGVVLALHLCSNVTVFGFSTGVSNKKKKARQVKGTKKIGHQPKGSGHYYNKALTRGTVPYKARHAWDVERTCLMRLHDNLDGVNVV